MKQKENQTKENEPTFTVEIPGFVKEVPIINEQEAIDLARKLSLPSVTETDDDIDGLIGLYFCRGRNTTPAKVLKSKELLKEARELPRDYNQLIDYFANRNRKDARAAIKPKKEYLEDKVEDFLKIELQSLKHMGIDVPNKINSLDKYFTWLAGNIQSSPDRKFKPNTKQLKAFKFSFLQSYVGNLGKLFSTYDPQKRWIKNWTNVQKSHFPIRTFYYKYKNHISTINGIKHGSFGDRNYDKKSLIFHVTPIKNALNIVNSGNILAGPNLGGVSFSANGLTFHTDEKSETPEQFVAFVLPYNEVEQSLPAMPFPDFFREYEREIRVSSPVSTDFVLGIVPGNKAFFPDIVEPGLYDASTIAGPMIDEMISNYQKSNRILSKRRLDELKRKIPALKYLNRREERRKGNTSIFSKLIKIFTP